MHPVGPLNPRVYWLRRVSVIVAAVIVLIGVGFLVVQKTKKSAGGPADAAAVSAAPTPTLTGVLAPRTAAPALPAASGIPASGTPTGVGTTTLTSTPPTSTAAGSTAAQSGPASTAPKSSPGKSTPGKATPGKTTPGKTTPGKATPAKATSGAMAPAKTGPVTTPAATPKSTSPSTAQQLTSTTPHPTAATTTRATPRPTSTPPPAPSTDAQGRLLCADASLRLRATTGSPTFAAGVQPILGVSVTNVGSATCTRDLSGGLQVFTVYSAAGARIWSTADCFPGSGTDVRTLVAGQALQYNIKWSGTSSNPGCTAVRVRVPAGRYQLQVAIGSLHAAPAAFTIA